jgi:hypothetical protein
MADTSNKSWDYMPFRVAIGEEFQNIGEVLAYKNAVFGSTNDVHNSQATNGVFDTLRDIFGIGDKNDPVQEMLSTALEKPYFRDTRVGANDAYNCLWQFNRDDDIMHMVHTINKEKCIGMGRVYATVTEQNQQICWFTFGLPIYCDLASFWKNAFDADLIELNHEGYTEGWTLSGVLGSVVKGGVKLLGVLFSLPAVPFKIIDWLTRSVRFNYHVNRFYELRANMPLYYDYVDSILAQWLVSTGIYNSGPNTDTKDERSWLSDPSYLPWALRESGVSIYDILKRRALNAGLSENTQFVGSDEDGRALRRQFLREKVSATPVLSGTSREILGTQGAEEIAAMRKQAASSTSSSKLKEGNPYSDDYSMEWWNNLKSSALGATQYVGFRIEKSVDASESFSNTASPSALAESFNSKMQSISSSELFKAATTAGSGIDAIDKLASGALKIVDTVIGTISQSTEHWTKGVAAAAQSGVYIDIPEQYSGSDFNKSHSINLKLRSPYGDLISIYQSIIVPLALILAGTLPRQSGTNSYMQPFLCRVYCKGMFSIPMGLIENISITRGSSEFGWTYNNLATSIDVSITIRDLSPIMYMCIGDKKLINPFAADNAFKEYMLTLAGTGLWERISLVSRWHRNVVYAAHKIRNVTMNPAHWQHNVSQWAPVSMVAALIPSTTISRR